MSNIQGSSSEFNLHALDYWQILKNKISVIVICFLLVFLTASVYTKLQTEVFMGKTIFEINPDPEEISIFKGTGISAMNNRNNYFRTQFEIMKSKENLIRVVQKHNLDDRWGTSVRGAYGRLLGMVNPTPVRGTDMIKLVIFSSQADEAANVAKWVRDEYSNRRREQEIKRITSALESLKIQLENQKEVVDARKANMNKIQRSIKYIGGGYRGGYGRDDGTSGLADIVIDDRRKLVSTSDRIKQFETQIKMLDNLTGEELINFASKINSDNNNINVLLPEYNQAILAERALRDSGLGDRHPEMIKLRGQLETKRRFINDSVNALKSSLKIELAHAKNSVKDLEQMTEKRKEKAIEESIGHHTFEQAEEDYKNQKSILAKMKKSYDETLVQVQMPRKPITIHEEAEANHTPIKPNPTRNLMVGAGAGLLLGILLAFALEFLDQSVKSIDDVEKYLQLPVLAVIPKGVPLLHQVNGMSPDAEAYRILRTNIEFNRKDASSNSITVVSGGAGEGKSTTLTNLAYICAQGGYSTIMIDADLRRPKLHTFFDINNSVGLTNYLLEGMDLEDVVLQTSLDNLYFMPSGILPEDAAATLNLKKMAELIAEVKDRFDIVLVDSPPILGVSDASVLASEVDLTMIVVQHRKLPKKLIMRVKQAVESVGGNLLGVVLNNVDINSNSQYQYYTSYYTYYSPTNSTNESKPAKIEENTDHDVKNVKTEMSSKKSTNVDEY